MSSNHILFYISRKQESVSARRGGEGKKLMDYQFFFWWWIQLSGIVNVSTGGNKIVIFCQNCDITNANIISKGGTVQNIS